MRRFGNCRDDNCGPFRQNYGINRAVQDQRCVRKFLAEWTIGGIAAWGITIDRRRNIGPPVI